MQNKEVALQGAVVFWVLTETDRERLRAEWEAQGLGSFVPEPRTKAQALKEALTETFACGRVLVRPLSGGNGYAVVGETATEATVTHVVDGTARLVDGAVVWDGSVAEWQRREADAAFSQKLQSLSTVAVARALSALVLHLRGVPLRHMGGVYWLPESALPAWVAAAAAAEHSAAGPHATRVYAVRTARDEASARAVIDALRADVRRRVEEISVEVDAGELGERALDSRCTESLQLCDKVEEYEQMFGAALDDLKEELGSLRQKATQLMMAIPMSDGEGM